MPQAQVRRICRRCSGRMVASLDGHSCLACGHVDYGADFKPLKLTVAEARLLEQGMAETDVKRGRRSAYRRNDHSEDDARPKGGPRYLYRAPAID
jgi:hypothetical protein